ncbi:MAG: hypothetical protein R3C44_03725 [Chloroflexota bacterium]
MNDKPHLDKRILGVGFAALALVLIIALLVLYPGATSARTGSPPPGLPGFEGEPVSVEFSAEGLSERTAAPRSIEESGWVVVLDDDFEAGISTTTWLNVDRTGAQNGEYKWGTRKVENPIAGGELSAWGVGGGADGDKLDPAKDGYPKNVDSWLIHGPFDMSKIVDASLDFNYYLEAQAGDSFSVLVSTDGATWQGSRQITAALGHGWDAATLWLNMSVNRKSIWRSALPATTRARITRPASSWMTWSFALMSAAAVICRTSRSNRRQLRRLHLSRQQRHLRRPLRRQTASILIPSPTTLMDGRCGARRAERSILWSIGTTQTAGGKASCKWGCPIKTRSSWFPRWFNPNSHHTTLR